MVTESQEPGGAGGGRPVTGLSDAELLKRHVDGDPEAFGVLFARHKDRLWAVAVRTMANPDDAADALQDAMISAFRRAASFRGESAVTTWLHRIVVNACLDRIRRRGARPEVSGGDERLLDAGGGGGHDPGDDSDLSMEVRSALRQLPHDQQVALVLVDMLGYPVAEAAELLGVAQGTVKSRCARGRARLAPRLSHLRRPAGDHGQAADAGLQAGRDGPDRPVRPDRPEGPDEPGGPAAQRGPGERAGPPRARNRFGSRSVLPARGGGEDEK